MTHLQITKYSGIGMCLICSRRNIPGVNRPRGQRLRRTRLWRLNKNIPPRLSNTQASPSMYHYRNGKETLVKKSRGSSRKSATPTYPPTEYSGDKSKRGSEGSITPKTSSVDESPYYSLHQSVERVSPTKNIRDKAPEVPIPGEDQKV